jgi:hypothetical protein
MTQKLQASKFMLLIFASKLGVCMNIWLKETGSKKVVGKNQTTRVFRMHFLELKVYYREFFFSTCKRIPAGGTRQPFPKGHSNTKIFMIIAIMRTG